MTALKIYGILFIVLGIPFGLTALDGLLPVSYFIAAGLLIIFFSKERVDDERVQQLKMKALFTTMSAGLGLTFLGYVVLRSVYRDLGPDALHHAVSAWDFLAGVLGLSLILFHYWRWQDARPLPASEI